VLAGQRFTARRSLDLLAVLGLALTVFAWAPLLGPLSFRAHDWRHALFYAVEFSQSVADGYLVPRWGPDFAFGRGYPVFVFYSPLSLYVVQSFRYAGLGVVASVKAAYVTGFLFGAAGMYRLARLWFGRQGALVATVLFTYLPYHLVDIYVRGALAEFWALAWFPWLFLAGETLVARPGRRSVAGFGTAYGGLVWLHSLSAILVTPFVGLFMVGRWILLSRGGSWKRAGRAVIAGIGGVGLGLWIAVGFLLPNMIEQKYIVLEQWTANNYQYDKQFVYLSQFLSPFWGFGYAVEGPDDGMAFQIGIVGVVTAVTALWLALRRALSGRQAGVVGVCAGLLLLALWAMTPASAPFWRAVPPLQFVQFPWRLLGVVVVLTAILAGAVGAWSARRETGSLPPSVVFLVLLSVLASLSYTVPQYAPPNPREETVLVLFDFEREYPDMVGYLATSRAQPTSSPMLAQFEAGLPPQKFRVVAGEADVEQLQYRGVAVEARVRARTDATVEVLTYFYPGWRAWLDGQEIPLRPYGPYGHIAFDVPAGEHDVTLRFTDTPARRAATAATGVGVIVAGLLSAGLPVGRRRPAPTPSAPRAGSEV